MRIKGFFGKGLGVALALVAGIYFVRMDLHAPEVQPGAVVLLVPDGTEDQTPFVRMWRDAAAEEGIHLQVLPASRWVRAVSRHQRHWPALIVPDTFHRHMDSAVVQVLHNEVEKGMRFMLVYDGGVLDAKGRYETGQSRFSNLVGMRYGLYDSLGEAMIAQKQLLGSAAMMEHLQIPPGRYLNEHANFEKDHVMFKGLSPHRTVAINMYGHETGLQKFPIFVIEGKPNGAVLLHTQSGQPIVSRHTMGAGETFFVNLPLGYLKQRTDGIFMASMLRYFVQDILQWPRLANTPDGVGGVVLNWHNDAMPALSALQVLEQAGIFQEGPFSFHFTVGPDVDIPGDGKGMNMPGNPQAQAVIRHFQAQGHVIGDHGGWIHNYFGKNIDETNQIKYEHYLDLNRQVASELIGQPTREYSAPNGNTTSWTLRWLERNRYLALYLTGDIGMGPTRTWLKNDRMSPSLWFFPVLTMGKFATAEDVYMQGVPVELYTDWLLAVGRFIENNQTVRLVYFHPPGAKIMLPSVKAFVDQMAACRKAGHCRWFTMTQMAEYLNRRDAIQWQLQPGEGADVVHASDANDLSQMAWWIPAQRYGKPEVLAGQARVDGYGSNWRVTATKGTTLQLRLPHIHPQTAAQ